eukprot:285940-Pleurochrysis_carterae.AAC.6
MKPSLPQPLSACFQTPRRSPRPLSLPPSPRHPRTKPEARELPSAQTCPLRLAASLRRLNACGPSSLCVCARRLAYRPKRRCAHKALNGVASSEVRCWTEPVA